MPLSKPVKHETVPGYPYADFVTRTEEEKRAILKPMSIDNLVNYIEHLIKEGHRGGSKQSTIVFKQIAESDFRSTYATNADFNQVLNDFINTEFDI